MLNKRVVVEVAIHHKADTPVTQNDAPPVIYGEAEHLCCQSRANSGASPKRPKPCLNYQISCPFVPRSVTSCCYKSANKCISGLCSYLCRYPARCGEEVDRELSSTYPSMHTGIFLGFLLVNVHQFLGCCIVKGGFAGENQTMIRDDDPMDSALIAGISRDVN